MGQTRAACGPLPASPMMEKHITGEEIRFSPCAAGELEGVIYTGHTRGKRINITMNTTIVNGNPSLKKSRGV